MTNQTENHLAKANHLRFSVTVGLIAVAGFCVIGMQKLSQWRAEKEGEAQRQRLIELAALKKAGQKEVEETKEELRRKVSSHPEARVEKNVPVETNAPPIKPVSARETAQAEKKKAPKPPPEPETPPTFAASFGYDPQSGSIRGRIVLNGTPPPEKTIDAVMKDPLCGKLHQVPPMTRFYVVGPDGALADVVVYLQARSGALITGFDGPFATPGERVIIDQKDCFFSPYVVAAQVGQIIEVKNSDPMMHNIHPTPTHPKNRESNKAQMPNAPPVQFKFDYPEAFLRLKCDVHPWMFSYISIFDHPYFAVTGADGGFVITNVPAGDYALVANHRKAGTIIQEIQVKKNKATQVAMSLAVPN